MEKWFRRSLMILGGLYIVLVPIAIMADSEGNELFDNLGIGLLLVSFIFMLIALISGVGTFFRWVGNRSTAKAKRGLMYQDETLNRIMKRLSDEERGYLEGYLSASSYEPVEGFDYLVDEKNQDIYR
jgi:hypothetical protein